VANGEGGSASGKFRLCHITVGNTAAYSVTANLTVANEELPAGLFLRPGIVVSVERSGKALFSYSKNYPRYGHKTRDGALNRMFMAIEKDLEENFITGLIAMIGVGI
jgi:hypothetical protein